jgi:RimJ/RimL family protein N-acetyltransferase
VQIFVAMEVWATMDRLVFQDINIEHIALINSWYHDDDSFHVEKLTEQYINYVASKPDFYCWIISNNNEFIGKVDFEIEEDKAYISIIIRPDYRRKGYGKKVLEQIINRYVNTGITQIVAGIYHTNEASIRLFSSVGFIPICNEPDQDGFINVMFHY